MGVIAWIVLGLVAGFLASMLVNKNGEGPLGDILLGVVGAVIGGIIANAMGFAGVTGFNVYSILIATGGAIVCLVIYHAVRGTRPARSIT